MMGTHKQNPETTMVETVNSAYLKRKSMLGEQVGAKVGKDGLHCEDPQIARPKHLDLMLKRK